MGCLAAESCQGIEDEFVSEKADLASDDPVGSGRASGKTEQPLRIIDQHRVDLLLSDAPLAHHRHDVLQNVCVSPSPVAGARRFATDILLDEDPREEPRIDQIANLVDLLRVVGDVQKIIRRPGAREVSLPSEDVVLEIATRFGQP